MLIGYPCSGSVWEMSLLHLGGSFPHQLFHEFSQPNTILVYLFKLLLFLPQF